MESFKPYYADIDDRGRVYIDIRVRRHDNKKTSVVNFMYDSGADVTTISLDDLGKLGYALDDAIANSYSRGTVTTAGGDKYEMFAMDFGLNNIMKQVFPPKLKFPFVCLIKETIKVPKHCKTGCELTGDIYRGLPSSLIGNDVLSAFDVASDRKNNKMVFTRLSDLNPRNTRYPHCELKKIQIVV